MKISLAVALLLLGTASAALTKNKMQKFINSRPQTNQAAQSCSTAINRFKEAVPDYTTIVKTSSNFWNDPQFPADSSSMSWVGTKYAKNTIGGYVNNKWGRLNDLCPTCTLFGTDDYLGDITQGGLGDCYYLAGISALAEIPTRFERAFVNPAINWAGLYAFNVYIRGIPHTLVIDDAIPAGQFGKKPVFAGFGTDGSIWGPLLEKAWAKTNVNYEKIEGGQSYEAFDFLSSAPHFYMKMDTLNV
jgi:hypothetical protein